MIELSRVRRSYVTVVLAAVLIGQAVAVAAQPASRPVTTRPAAKEKKPDAIRVAIADLTREAARAIERKEPFPRVESDYFKQKPADVDAGELLKALGRPIARDPRVDAYIKLQLLSAVEKFEGQHVSDALDAYVTGMPQLIPVPNSMRDMQPWDQKRMQAKEKDIEQINTDFLAWRGPHEDRNDVILRYRDQLRERIEVSSEQKPRLFKAQVEDLSQRYEAGFEPTKDWTSLSKNILAWAQLAPKKEVTDLLGFLGEYAKRPPRGVYYEKLMWSDRRNAAYWRDRPGALEKRKLEKLIDELKTAERNAL